MEQFDIVILGGGPGGTAAAEILAKAGKKVALVSDELGGECLNYGCIPTKTHLWTAELFEKLAGAEALGIETDAPKINWLRLKQRRFEIVSKLKKGLVFSLERAGVKIIEGRGKLIDANTVTLRQAQGDNTETSMTAKSIIIATGSEAVFPPGFEKNDKNLGSHEILELEFVPKSLLIIGAGAVGVEFASIFSIFGTKVTIAEAGSRILRNEDPDISVELKRVFVRRGITILENTKIQPSQTAEYEKVLIASGRKPHTAGLGMKSLGIQTDSHGIVTNEQYQTNIPNIFAIGDVAGKSLLAYTAAREGKIAAAAILGKNPAPLRYETIPNTIFSLPEVASVGLNEETAKADGREYVVGKNTMSANAKALIMGNRDGFAKIIAEEKTGRILGVHIIGERASELIGEASLALCQNLTLQDFAENIHGHPVLGESLQEACGAAMTAP